MFFARAERLLGRRDVLLAIVLMVFSIEFVRTAWISDDAMITLRAVLNFIHGYGPVFNLDERVQAFTHPLWFLLLCAGSVIFGNIFAATFILCAACSVLSIAVLLNLASSRPLAVLAAASLLLSKSFIDFSSSGLENSLSNLLLPLFFVAAMRAIEGPDEKYVTLATLSASALYLTHPDLCVLIAPLFCVMLYMAYRSISSTIRSLIIGFLPAALWTFFSLFYYGFPFPNTAYAKIGNGVAASDLMYQGLNYFRYSLLHEPLVVLVFALALFVSLYSDRARIVMAGVVLYCLYVISIGGDFMGGRLLVAPFIVCVFIIVQEKQLLARAGALVMLSAIAALGLFNINATLFSSPDYSSRQFELGGIDDERGFYFMSQSLLHWNIPVDIDWRARTPALSSIVCGGPGLGLKGLLAGPSGHIVDTCGLSDPLLARLPAVCDPDWRPGHFARALPDGYLMSVFADKNLLSDPTLHTYYDSIRLITRGPLFSVLRIEEIALMNVGLRPRPYTLSCTDQ
jgi:arabinofuranosyltransferase